MSYNIMPSCVTSYHVVKHCYFRYVVLCCIGLCCVCTALLHCYALFFIMFSNVVSRSVSWIKLFHTEVGVYVY